MLVFNEVWTFLAVSAPFLLLGFFLSGVVHALLPMDKVKKWLGNNRYRDIFLASAIGVPLPLCSCGVIPAAVALKKAGASRASVSSFLISTPESGVDSIFVTYALMDFPMSVFRPVSAFISATVAGLFNHWFNQEKELQTSVNNLQAQTEKKTCCQSNKNEIKENKDSKQDKAFAHPLKFFRKVFHYGFVDLVDDLAGWMSIGIILGALVSILIPDQFFQTLSPTTSRFLVMLVGIPMYICASASTPIAASLVLKGMSPGVALIFLLTGPATNIANIAVLQKHIGIRGTIINVTSIALCALLLSYLVDGFYAHYGQPQFKIMSALKGHHENNYLNDISAVVLLVILSASFFRTNFKKVKNKTHSH